MPPLGRGGEEEEEEEEEEMFLSSLLRSDLLSQMPQGETKGRRRRRKAKGEEDGKKRRLSDEQVKFLEMNFGREKKLELGRKEHLATELGLDPKQVSVWFQNRRARWKNKQMEEQYLRLKSMHDSIIVEKCHLENEVLKLKERLSEAEGEIKKLTENQRRSFCEELGGGGGGGGGVDLMHISDCNCNSYLMDLVSFYGV